MSAFCLCILSQVTADINVYGHHFFDACILNYCAMNCLRAIYGPLPFFALIVFVNIYQICLLLAVAVITISAVVQLGIITDLRQGREGFKNKKEFSAREEGSQRAPKFQMLPQVGGEQLSADTQIGKSFHIVGNVRIEGFQTMISKFVVILWTINPHLQNF